MMERYAELNVDPDQQLRALVADVQIEQEMNDEYGWAPEILREHVMHNERKQQQIEQNRKLLASLGDGDANREHIFKRFQKRIEAMRLISIMFKRIRQDHQRAQSELEIYLDDWVYHHGPIDYLPSKEHPMGGPVFQNAMEDCIDRIAKQREALEQQKADAEHEFEDDATMKDFPL